MIEFALVGMLLATMAFGTIEYGYGWRSSMSVLTAARAGARSVASMGTDNQSDYFALTSIRTNLDSAGLLDGLQRVVVYRADATNGDPPAVCTGTPITATTDEVQRLHRRPGAGGGGRTVQRDHRLHDRGTVKNYCPNRRDHRAGHRRLDRRVRAGEAEVAHRLLRRRRASWPAATP